MFLCTFFQQISLVPIEAVRGIYERLSRDAKTADEWSKKYKQKADDEERRRQSRSSSTSTDGRLNDEQEKRSRVDESPTPGRMPNGRCNRSGSVGEQGKRDNREFEKAVHREDVVKGSAAVAESASAAETAITCSSSNCILPEELPPPLFTKQMLERFRMLEESSATRRHQQQQLQQQHQKQRQQQKEPKPLSRAVSAPSTPVRRPAPAAIHPDAAQQCRSHQQLSASPSPSPFDREMSMSFSDSGADDLVLGMHAAALMAAEDDGGRELPHRGLTKALLAQWRHIEDRMRGSKTEQGGITATSATSTTRHLGVTSACRSQSMPGIPDVGLSRRSSSPSRSDIYAFTVSSQRDEKWETASAAAAKRLPSSSTTEGGDNLPPPLMTQYMLAKFRDMEAESQIISGLQSQSKKVEKFCRVILVRNVCSKSKLYFY